MIIRVEGGHYTGSSQNSCEGRWWRTLVVSTGLSRAATIALGADESSGAASCVVVRGGVSERECGEGREYLLPATVLRRPSCRSHASASRKYVLSVTCSSTLYILLYYVSPHYTYHKTLKHHYHTNKILRTSPYCQKNRFSKLYQLFAKKGERDINYGLVSNSFHSCKS